MLNKTMKFEDLITFTRNSAATYWDVNGVLQTAAMDEPRFDHGRLTGEPLGIFCENAGTNLIKSSEDLTNGDWQILSSATVTKEADEDGCTVHKIDFNGDSGAIVRALGDITGGLFHYEVRADSPTTFRNRGTTDGSGIAVPVVNVTTEWVRHEFAFDGSTYADVGWQCNSSGDSAPIYVRLIQAEISSLPTSYIPTLGAQATRSADVLSVTLGALWYENQRGTLLLNYDKVRSWPATGLYGSNNNLHRIGFTGTTGTLDRLAAVVDSELVNFDSEGPAKAALSWTQEGGAIAAVDGVSEVISESISTIEMTRLDFNRNASGSIGGGGYIRSIQYFPRAFSASELEEATS